MSDNLPWVDVEFEDASLNYSTSVSKDVSKESAEAYFLNKWFDRGVYPQENHVKCIKATYHE